MLVSEIRRKTQKQRGQVTERKTLNFLKTIVVNRSIGEGEDRVQKKATREQQQKGFDRLLWCLRLAIMFFNV